MSPTTSPEFPNQDPTGTFSPHSQTGQLDAAPAGGDDKKQSGHTNARSRIFRLFVGIVLAILIWQEAPREIGRWYYAAYLDHSLDNDNVGALRMIKHAIHWDAENTTYWLECGNTYMMLGDYEQSWSKFDRAKKLLQPQVNARPNPKNLFLLAHVLNGGAYARALGGSELKQATKDVEQALRSFPTSAAMIDTRGYICYLRGDYEQALIDTNTAVEMSTATYERDKRDTQRKMLKSIRRRPLAKELRMLEETLAELHEHRGLVYQKLGKEDAAQRDLTVAEMYKSRIVAER